MNTTMNLKIAAIATMFLLSSLPGVSAEEGDGGDGCNGGVTIDLSFEEGGNCNGGDGCENEEPDTEGCEGGETCNDSIVVVSLRGCHGGDGSDGGDGCDGQDATDVGPDGFQGTLEEYQEQYGAGDGCDGSDGGNGGSACNDNLVAVTESGCVGGNGGSGGTGGEGGSCDAEKQNCDGADGGEGGSEGQGGEACNRNGVNVNLNKGCIAGDNGCAGDGGQGGEGGDGKGGNGTIGEQGTCVNGERVNPGESREIHFAVGPNTVNDLTRKQSSESANSEPDGIYHQVCQSNHPEASLAQDEGNKNGLVGACNLPLAIHIWVNPALFLMMNQNDKSVAPQVQLEGDLQVQIVAIFCTYNPGYYQNRQLCNDSTKEGMCEGPILIFINSEDQCEGGGSRDPDDDGSACEAKIVIFINSDDNCTGEPGGDGCDPDQIRLMDPDSTGNCAGGDGLGAILNWLRTKA